MTTIVTRAGKGSPLTHTEVDTNFTNLNTNKLETAAIPLGTLAAPSISFVGDANTGAYSPGADTLAFVTAGSNRVHITSGGLVGIGTSSPVSILDVTVGGSGTRKFVANYDDSIITIKGSNDSSNPETLRLVADNLRFSTGTSGSGTERLRITSAGLVGIGNTTSGFTNNLIIGSGTGDNGATIYAGTASSSILHFADGSSGADRYRGGIVYNHANNSFNFATNDTSAVTIDSSQRLLVGTSTAYTGYGGSADNKLQIAGNLYTNAALSAFVFGATPVGGYINLGLSRNTTVNSHTIVQSGDQLGLISFNGSDGTNFESGAEIFAVVDGTPGNNDMPTRLVFSTTADGASSPTERMRINSGGFLKATNDATYVSTAAASFHEFRTDRADWIAGFTNKNASPTGIFIGHNTDINNTGNIFLGCYGGASYGTLRAEIRTNGGLANYSANNANLSDRNVKKDITLAAGTWDCIKEWEIVNYRYKDQSDDADLNLGVIAQQVAESCPEVIIIFQEAKDETEDKPAQEERLGVKEQQMYWMAIKALQEAQVRIETLEDKVAALESA